MKYILIGLISVLTLTSCQSTIQSFSNNLKGVHAPQYDLTESKTFDDSIRLIFPKQKDSEAYKNINFIFSRHDTLAQMLMYTNIYGYHHVRTNTPSQNWGSAKSFNLYDMNWMGAKGSLILSPEETLTLVRQYCHFSDNKTQKCMTNSSHDAHYTLSSKADISNESDKTVLTISNIRLDLKHDNLFKAKKMELHPGELVKYVNNFRHEIKFTSEYSVQSTLANIERTTKANKQYKTGVVTLSGQDFIYFYTVDPYKHGSLASFIVSIPPKDSANTLDFNYATDEISDYFEKLVKQELI